MCRVKSAFEELSDAGRDLWEQISIWARRPRFWIVMVVLYLVMAGLALLLGVDAGR